MSERKQGAPRPDDESPTAIASPASDQGGMPRPDRIGSIVLTRELGAGASGHVWFGRDEALARDVAVKVFNIPGHPDAPLDFDDGARRVSSVSHPNLAGLYAAGVHEGRPYLVMEYVPGWTVAEVSQRLGPLEAEIVAAIGVELCAGLAAMHASDLAHRDIKPSNVMLRVDGRIVVTDFGLAVQRPTASLSAADACLAGTPSYMAPEMFDGVVSTRTDVYAAGLTLAETLGARRLVWGDFATVKAIHRAGLIDLYFVPEPLRDTLQRCVQVSPLFRFKSALQLQQALTPLAASAPNALASLADRMRSAESPQEIVQRPPSTRSSIEEALNTITEHRTREREGAAESSPPPLAATAKRPVESIVPLGYFCVACGYDLSGADRAAPCPECGSPLDPSLLRRPLRALGEEGLESLHRRLLWFEYSVGVFFGVSIAAGLAALGGTWTTIASSVAMLLVSAGMARAAWSVASIPHLDHHDPSVHPTVLAGLFVTSGLLATIAYVWSTQQPESSPLHYNIGQLAWILQLFAWERICRRGGEFARRTPPPTIALRRLRLACWLFWIKIAMGALGILFTALSLAVAPLAWANRHVPIFSGTMSLHDFLGLMLSLIAIFLGMSGSYLLRRAIRNEQRVLRVHARQER